MLLHMTQVIEGEVTSGLGEGKDFMSLDGYVDQFRAKLGYVPYPGTLNLKVETKAIPILEEQDPIHIREWENGDATYGAVNCYPVSVSNQAGVDPVPVHAIVPDRTDHDPTVLELISPVNLRETFNIDDGAVLRLELGPRPTEAE